MISSSLPHIPLGYHAFDRLQAEHEGGWLADVFIRPPDFDAIAGMRSVIIFGESGAGKTALRLALARQGIRPDGAPVRLVVLWQPELSLLEPSGGHVIQEFLKQALDACALALMRHLGRWPDVCMAAPPWVRDTVGWFVHQYLIGDHAYHLSRMEDEATPQGWQILQELIGSPPRPILPKGAPTPRVIATLATAIHRLGLDSIWVVVDGLEPWVSADVEPLAQAIKALLSTLALFEDPGFAMKLLVPVTIETMLLASGGIMRRRLDVYRLAWEDEQLQAIVERRLALATGRAAFRLVDLCAAPQLIDWLKTYGGGSPRGWLELVGQLAETYIARGMDRPLSMEEWVETYRRHPPRLHMDLATDRIFIGYAEIDDLQPGSYRLIRYLYEQRPRMCSRSELYYRAHLGLDQEPRARDDKGWEEPTAWSGTIDTLLWRLRQRIEPDPKRPLYIYSDRGRGVRLKHVE
jgi:hypothetical protein